MTALRPLRGSAAVAASLLLASTLSATGCATYTDNVRAAHLAAAAGDHAGAIAQFSTRLGVATADEVPSRLTGDRPLLLLDRGVLQQATTRWEASQRDLSTAEQHLEILDLTTNAVAALGSYLYSDSAKTYKVPPSERLAINSINLLNYVARGDLAGAAVEARRFQVMREYLASIRAAAPAPDRLGAWLSGFVFEKGGESDRAMRYYDEALASGPLSSLVDPVRRLAPRSAYRGRNLAALVKAGPKPAAGGAEILVVVARGRVPHKVPERMPVGAAVGIAGAMLGDRDLDVLKYSATKVLVYPALAETPSGAGEARLSVDGAAAPLELLADLSSSVRAEYEAAKPKILAAALTRMAARAAVSEGTRAAGRQEGDALGDVLAILVESAMVALDRPDTRSWTMLPGRVDVARVAVPPGVHQVEVSFTGAGSATRRVGVDLKAGGWAAVVVTEPR